MTGTEIDHRGRSPLFLDSAVEVREGEAIDPQTATLQLLEEILAELRRANSTAREGAVSSVEIKYLAPTKDNPQRTPQPVIKAYAGSVVPVDEAIEAYGRTVREMERRAMAGWAETLEAGRAVQEGGS